MRQLKFLTLSTVIATLLCVMFSCKKENATPVKHIGKIPAGNWKYETDTIKVYLAVVDSTATVGGSGTVTYYQWQRSGVVIYKTATGIQSDPKINPVIDGNEQFDIHCSISNPAFAVQIIGLTSNDARSVINAQQLVLYYNSTTPIVVSSITFNRR